MDLIRGTGWVEASPGSTGHQLEHGVGIKENQTILKQKNAERCGKTESIKTFRARQKIILKIQDIYVKSKSVSSWSCRSYVNPTTRPRSTPQPLATTSKSFSHRTQWTITRNKLISDGKIYFDGNLTCNMTLVYCAVLVGCRTSKLPSPPCPLKKKETLNIYFVL